MRCLLALLLTACSTAAQDTERIVPVDVDRGGSWYDPVTQQVWSVSPIKIQWAEAVAACGEKWRLATSSELELARSRGMHGDRVWGVEMTVLKALTYDLATGDAKAEAKTTRAAGSACMKNPDPPAREEHT